MNSLLKVIVPGILAFCAAVSPAIADGLYGALDGGQAKGKDACAGATTACDDTADFVRAAVGYQFTPMLSAEVSYGASEKASLGVVFPGVTGAWEADFIQISGIGTFPLGGGFALSAKAGIARTEITLTTGGLAAISTSSTTTKAAFGIGASFDFSNRFAVRAQYEDFGTIGDVNTTGESKLSLLSAGLVLKF